MNEEKPKLAAERQDKPKSRFGLLRALPIILVLLLLAGGVYIGFMFLEQKETIESVLAKQNSFTQQDATNTSELLKLQSSLERANNSIMQLGQQGADQLLELERLNREVISARLRINDTGQGPNQLWTIEEAESLLRLAQQRLIVSKDTRSALALFVASDDILKQINDPAIFAIRNILASEMAALRAVSEVDVQGIYLQLETLSQSLDFLEVETGIKKDLNNNSGIATESEESGFWDSMLAYLGTFVIVQKSGETISPLLSPEQNFNLKQNIKLQLEQAKIGLLQENTGVYQSSLLNALSNIEQYLGPEGVQKQSIQNGLNVLFETPIVVQIPAVSNGLAAIQQILPLTELEPTGENE